MGKEQIRDELKLVEETEETYYLKGGKSTERENPRRTLTNAQKELIRKRDGYKCQYPEPHICNGHEKTLHVHHITPTRWMQEHLGVPASEADSPLNLISVCEEIHIGGRRNRHILHPDVPRARILYGQGNKNAYEEILGRERREKMERGEMYWDPIYDNTFRIRAMKQTGIARKAGWFDWEAAGRRNGNSRYNGARRVG
ncbi:MAG TPA: hypothetical protein VF189_04860 [Patescibacteria group bacterium]